METTEWLLAAVVLTNVTILLTILKGREDQKRANRQQSALLGLLTARQSKIKSERVHHASPGVDARARTTRRDSHDIPTIGGTQRPIKFRTVGGPDGNPGTPSD